jgi:hypothetical protein
MSGWKTDDLASVLVGGDMQPVGRTQGIIQAFDPDTFENTVAFGGAQHQDLVVTNPVDALSYQPGDVVIVEKWAPSGRGFASYAIAGRWLVPAGGNAAAAVGFLQTGVASAIVDELVEQLLTSPAGVALAQFVNSQVFHFASDTGAGTVSSSSWTDLSGASVGPTCSGVEISSERRALVIVSALMTAAANERPHMSFAVTGASSFTPGTGFSDQFDLRLRTANQGFDARLSAVIPLGPSELTSAGTHTFTAKYRATIGTPSFSARTLAVIAY